MKTDTLPMLSPQDWALLNEHVKPVAHAKGRIILAEGGHRRALHIVKSGTVRVEQAQNGQGIALALLGPGAYPNAQEKSLLNRRFHCTI